MSPPPPEKGKAQESKGSSRSNRNASPDATDISSEGGNAGPDLSVFDPEFASVEPQHPQVGQSESAASPKTKLEEQNRRPRFEDTVPHSSDSETMATRQASNASTPSEAAVKNEDSSNEEGSSSTHDEDPDGNEDPSETVQQMMVDSVMTSFMDWLDVKLKVKGEEEKEDLSSLPLLGAPQPMTEGLNSTLSPRFTAPMPVPTGFAPLKPLTGAFGSGQTSGTDKAAESYTPAEDAIIIHEKQSSSESLELSKKGERAEDIERKRTKLGELRATREGLRSDRDTPKESLVQSLVGTSSTTTSYSASSRDEPRRLRRSSRPVDTQSALRALSLSEESAEDERHSTMPMLASAPPRPAPKAKSSSFSNLLKRSKKKKSVEDSEEEKRGSGLEKAEEENEDEDEDDEEVTSGAGAASELATSRGAEAVEELMAYPPGVLNLDSEPRGSPPFVGGSAPVPAVPTRYEAVEEVLPKAKANAALERRYRRHRSSSSWVPGVGLTADAEEDERRRERRHEREREQLRQRFEPRGSASPQGSVSRSAASSRPSESSTREPSVRAALGASASYRRSAATDDRLLLDAALSDQIARDNEVVARRSASDDSGSLPAHEHAVARTRPRAVGSIQSSGNNKLPVKPGRKKRSLASKRSRLDGKDNGNEDEEGNDGDRDGNGPPRAKLPKVQEEQVSGAKLACPFFKHNPRKYKNQRPCCGPGWDHVHRIKEHIYRKHSLPKFSCPRCSQPFETQADLQAHARLLTPCEVKEPEVLDGITQDQEKKLRSRKKTSSKELTEAEKWTQVYSILFPDVREREIPSPYYNIEDAQTNLGGYEDYLRRELPTQVRRQLEKEVEQQLSFVEEGMKQKVIEIARNLQLTLFKSYQQIETQERDTEGPSPSAGYISNSDFVSFTATDTSPSTMTTAGTTPEMPDPLEIFGGDPAIPDFNFDFLSQVPSAESQGPQKACDPAFGIDRYATSGPPTIQPGMEMFGGQQFGMSYYDMEDYDERQGTVRDMSVLSYAP
ncbi:hypothetical protein GCG54_00014568 [Colletotrichum gloeosporioides]|uniref:C2H2-type domain-containing protein n=1 Tax=Colletotrichum gloeosporioides TaxID=474922 RepID=A0A8H4CX90_COLGL|nr:uncharacterized protein GCG54_00014568 [Colletotrichum gloeosporioides]KAF3811813.1 hypothetical protein GCG54_00014568 [Colletotrichum gloeosporioides]